MSTEQTKLIIQALESAEKNLVLAKKLLDGEGVSGPGVVGKFDGESIVTEKGQKHYVPSNYASKSRLVVGDTLRMIGQGEKALFKQIEKKERVKVSGVLTKKDGQWVVVAAEGSFFVLPVSVQYFKGEIGDEVEIVIPKDYKMVKSKWAALEQVLKEEKPTSPKPSILPSEKVVKKAESQRTVKEQSKQPKKPETPKTTKKTATSLRPAVGRTSAGQVAEGVEKSAEVQKEVLPKQLKKLKEPKLKGEIKVEEELR